MSRSRGKPGTYFPIIMSSVDKFRGIVHDDGINLRIYILKKIISFIKLYVPLNYSII